MLSAEENLREVMNDLVRPIAESLRVSDFFVGRLTGDLSGG